MDKQLAQHRTQEQRSRIAAAAHLNYEFAMYSRTPTRKLDHFEGASTELKKPGPLAKGPGDRGPSHPSPHGESIVASIS
jgi:hypothetical protein